MTGHPTCRLSGNRNQNQMAHVIATIDEGKSMNGSTWWRRPVFIVPVGLATIGAIVVALVAFQPWRLFIDVTVNEELPSATSSSQADGAAPSNREAAESLEITDSPSTNETTTPSPTPEPTPERVIDAEGTFISHEHPTAGKARIITLEDGSRILRLVGLDTDNGPDLKVWLAAAPVIEGREGWFVFDDDEYLDLGPLKGNKGNQNYPIPAEADITDLTSVTIWCDRFSVSFGAAELVAA